MNTNFADVFSELGNLCKPKQNTKWHDLISYYLVHGVALDVKYNFFFPNRMQVQFQLEDKKRPRINIT